MTSDQVSPQDVCKPWYEEGFFASDGFRNVATIATIVLGFVTIFVQNSQQTEQMLTQTTMQQSQAKLQRELAANASWQGYMDQAVRNPNLAEGTKNYGNLTIDEKAKYAWFVERMLFAGEQIVTVMPDDELWKSSIQIEIKRHLSFLEHDDFLKDSLCDYEPRMAKLITSISDRAGDYYSNCKVVK
jgi:hypothetical protein